MNVSSPIAIGVMRSEPRPAAKRAMTLRREHAGIDCECATCDMAGEEVQSKTVSLISVTCFDGMNGSENRLFPRPLVKLVRPCTEPARHTWVFVSLLPLRAFFGRERNREHLPIRSRCKGCFENGHASDSVPCENGSRRFTQDCVSDSS